MNVDLLNTAATWPREWCFVHPIDDEWVIGLLGRVHWLACVPPARTFFRKFLSTSDFIHVDRTARRAIASGRWGEPAKAAGSYGFMNYFRQFLGGLNGGRFPERSTDLWVTGRCKKEHWIAAPMLHSQMRACEECCEEQDAVHGFRTWLRSHNLPGVTACWKHGRALAGISWDPSGAMLPHRRISWPSRLASTEEICFANISHTALLAEGVGRHFVGGLRSSKSIKHREWKTKLIADAIVEMQPPSFLQALGLHNNRLRSGLDHMAQGTSFASIGYTPLILLASMAIAGRPLSEKLELAEVGPYLLERWGRNPNEPFGRMSDRF